ncbi:uncharacterized protein N7511_007933 [Penicillium nucicola]|uniref:uncharacterized protein n=1 Tax=Penicillium nucicola TaxID=1850975 RepID=UPI0025452799|nr:uncharacterized protein N7511_007933 [Penicillium nucicola]KAJ5753780.1 hypothetical protein N7511_007933 [Penicillium nucicola]
MSGSWSIVLTLPLAALLWGNPLSPSNSKSIDLPWPPVTSSTLREALPESVHVSPEFISKGLTETRVNGSGESVLNFTKTGDIYTLDYGVDVAGKATFEVSEIKGNPQIEVKYSEAFNGLLVPQSDGPFAFSNALAGTFRIETFNITKIGPLDGFFIQGSQRWQSIKLVKGEKLVIKKIGITPTVDQTPISSIKGYFASSNASYTDIWALGPRTQQLACYGPGSQTSSWEITPNGAYIRGQKPASTARVPNISNYTLTFETMIDFGGTGWRVDTEIDAIQATGPIFILTSNYPEGSFANIDRSLVPPNTLVLGRGWSLQNQTSLPGYVLDKFSIGFNVTEKTWHTIKTESPGDDTYSVYLDSHRIAHFNISSYGLGDPNPYIQGGATKSFAFGPWQDQAAYVRNVNVTLSTGENVYSNPMTDSDVLIEYGVHSNDKYACSDSGKRDRYDWLGDRFVSSRVIMASTHQSEYVWGPAEQMFSRQTSSGQIPINTLFSPLNMESALIRAANVDPLLVDYNFDFMQTIYNYWYSSGNDTFIKAHWPQMVASTSYAMSRSLDPATKLFGAPSGALGLPLSGQKGQALGPAVTVSMILGLERLADMADYLGYYDSANRYKEQARLSRNAIETLLWNETGGYFTSTLGGTDFDVLDIAQVLLAKIGTTEQRTRTIERLVDLQFPAGYSNGTRYVNTPGIVNPYSMSFLLEGLAMSNETEMAQNLLDATWGPMVRRDSNYTGGYWEYVSPDGAYPGIDLFTGLSHFWGSYPTVFLTEHVLGIRAASVGYKEFVFAPLTGFKTNWVQGRVPTPHGIIYAAWGYGSNGKIIMEIEAPKGVKGKLVPPFDGSYSIADRTGLIGNATVSGGVKVTIMQI